jgi:phage repressor protein C with HTH and peptisase S24 domain
LFFHKFKIIGYIRSVKGIYPYFTFLFFYGINPKMSDLKARIQARLSEIGVSATMAAKSVGLDTNFINDILRGKKKTIALDKIDLVAQALKLTRDQLTDMIKGVKPVPAYFIPLDDHPNPRQLPVYGVAMCGEGDEFSMPQEAVDYMDCPPEMTSVKGAYALYAQGESMRPQVNPGNKLIVNPTRPPMRDDLVVVQLKLECGAIVGVIKQYVKRTATELVLYQHNPPKGQGEEVKYKLAEVQSIHVVYSVVMR